MARLNGKDLVEQKITKQISVTAGTSNIAQFTIPQGRIAYVAGYGFDNWYDSNIYQFKAGNFQFPTRTDQEGSVAMPQKWTTPYPVNSGEVVSFTITNNDSSDHTYNVAFFMLVDAVLPEASTGGALTINTAGSSGTGNNVAIWDSTFTDSAPVDSVRGVAVQTKSPTSVINLTRTTSGAAALQLITASTPCNKLTLRSLPTNDPTAAIQIGNATAQDFVLYPGESISIDISNANLIYFKRTGSVDVTLIAFGS